MELINSEKTIRDNYKKLTKMLIDKGLSITTMESCTAGQIASLITDAEGSSAVIKGAFVTYSNEIKIQCGVPSEVINKYSVYSLETAEAMALAAKNNIPSDISIGVTGTMGNIDPLNEEFSEEGIVYYAISFKDNVYKYKASIPCQESRLMYKLVVSELIYERLMTLLNEFS